MTPYLPPVEVVERDEERGPERGHGGGEGDGDVPQENHVWRGRRGAGARAGSRVPGCGGTVSPAVPGGRSRFLVPPLRLHVRPSPRVVVPPEGRRSLPLGNCSTAEEMRLASPQGQHLGLIID
ncbi:unnamed protein product [Pleuronectes platessa]|uniref:Uncharacterized protein n=1 Tax=Pleuronectes platessa TaxID=8262 RepID=A0A9N7UUK6_PLEPL|nr:unnamed protein product [Pleuronectes platessa]